MYDRIHNGSQWGQIVVISVRAFTAAKLRQVGVAIVSRREQSLQMPALRSRMELSKVAQQAAAQLLDVSERL
jgi:hypothetical protein